MTTNLAQKNFAQQTVRDVMQGYGLENQIQNANVIRQGNQFDNIIKEQEARLAPQTAAARLAGLQTNVKIGQENLTLAERTRELHIADLMTKIQTNQMTLAEARLKHPYIVAEAEARLKALDAGIQNTQAQTENVKERTEGERYERENVTTIIGDDGKEYKGIPNTKALDYRTRQKELDTRFGKLIIDAEKNRDIIKTKALKEKYVRSKLSAAAELKLVSTDSITEEKLVHMRVHNENSQEPFVYIRRGENFEKIKLPPVKKADGTMHNTIGEEISRSAKLKGISVENYLEQVYYPQHLGRPAPWKQER